MESYVGKSVNSLPLILPVHTAPLDVRYLDTINQARIEFINVKNNLSVSLLNGKNFSTIAKQLIYSRNTTQQKYDFAKIQGVSFAHNYCITSLTIQVLFEVLLLDSRRRNVSFTLIFLITLMKLKLLLIFRF